MVTSVFSTEVQAVFDNAEKSAGIAGGPFPSPADWRDQVIYFIMVDRFNNPDSKPEHVPYDDPSYGLYQGGSFAGVREQLGYIKDLGAGTIWLSPVLKNLPWDSGSYHGYGIHDFLRAEPRFAKDPTKADDELRALVDAAHAAGLYVIFDIVLNHTGDVFAYNGSPQAPFSPIAMTVQWRDEQGEATSSDADIAMIPNPSTDALVWPSELQENMYFRRQGLSDPNGDDRIGDFDSLKQMMTADRDVQRFLIRAYQYVIARYDADGFRIDTIRYLQNNLAQVFGNSVREYAMSIGKKNFFTFGEVLDADPETDIAKFTGRDTRMGGDINSLVGVDAALDYPLYYVLTDSVKGIRAPSVISAMYNRRKTIEQFILSSHGDASRYFVSFLDNHDTKKRFRWVQPGNENFYDDQLTMGIACLYCLPGIPCIYYGTEQGLHGFSANGTEDPAVREALWGIFPDFPQSTHFYTEMQKVIAVRNAEAALRYGRFYFRQVSGDGFHFGISNIPGGILAWSRILNDAELLIVANSNISQTLSVDVILEKTLSSPGQNMRVLYSNKIAFTPPTPVANLVSVSVEELDGTIGTGPLNTTRISLLPMEVQIIRSTN
jgi:glycosidase